MDITKSESIGVKVYAYSGLFFVLYKNSNRIYKQKIIIPRKNGYF